MVQMQEIMEMSVAERILMIEKIWDSIDHNSIETPASHQEELDRRLARFEKGETTFYSWADIKKELSAAK
ncbi:MAG: addiction module protein [Mucilaginibacter sp.]